ncbi:MAG: hypothetical protein IJL32_09015 [Oscillospiraceae bacterium]|nr:hypothetical protein [Oscillospiraceae bacterium]
MQIRCECTAADSTVCSLTDCLQFVLVRDRYLPNAVLRIRTVLPEAMEEPVRIRLFLDDFAVHDGNVQTWACERKNGQLQARIESQSFAAALMKNQLIPGLYTQVTLASLLETYHLPYITCEDVPSINYIVVKDNTAMWDSIVAYNYKLCHSYPFVRLPNLLCMMPRQDQNEIILPEQAILSESTGGSTADMISRVDMADEIGEYGSFTRSNPEALRRGITRVRQILLDRQYLYNPYDALQFRIDVSNRRMHSKTVRYAGYCGEDLEDLASCSFVRGRVSRIVIAGDRSGITTEDTFCFDPFCNTAS